MMPGGGKEPAHEWPCSKYFRNLDGTRKDLKTTEGLRAGE
jgi:hypothetical protein